MDSGQLANGRHSVKKEPPPSLHGGLNGHEVSAGESQEDFERLLKDQEVLIDEIDSLKAETTTLKMQLSNVSEQLQAKEAERKRLALVNEEMSREILAGNQRIAELLKEAGVEAPKQQSPSVDVHEIVAKGGKSPSVLL